MPFMYRGLLVAGVIEMASHYVENGHKSSILAEQLRTLLPLFKVESGTTPKMTAQPMQTEQPKQAQAMDERECDIPPFGWRCTRPAGHCGPCAAVEAPEDVSLVERGMARYRAGVVAQAQASGKVVPSDGDIACRFTVWWAHNRSKFTTTRQAAYAAMSDALKLTGFASRPQPSDEQIDEIFKSPPHLKKTLRESARALLERYGNA